MIWDKGECFWCGVTQYASCKHRGAIPRPEITTEPKSRLYISGGGSYRTPKHRAGMVL